VRRRRTAAAADRRRFHNALIGGGALPLAALEQQVEEWFAGEWNCAERLWAKGGLGNAVFAQGPMQAAAPGTPGTPGKGMHTYATRNR
jgi:hypothetical protein